LLLQKSTAKSVGEKIENRLSFGKVRAKNRMVPFLPDTVYFRYIGKSREQSTVTRKFLGHNRPTDHVFEECYAS